MKKVRFLLIIVTIFFNGFLIVSSKNATADVKPTQKGILGVYQGLSICHCPDSLENCWCS